MEIDAARITVMDQEFPDYVVSAEWHGIQKTARLSKNSSILQIKLCIRSNIPVRNPD